MPARLEGKVAVVTGGASGMGLATVRRFVEEGARVVVADLNEVGQPDDVAGAVLFLATDDARFVTGDKMLIDGGMVAAGSGATMAGGPGTAPLGFVGVNRGSTGEPTLVRQRPTAPS